MIEEGATHSEREEADRADRERGHALLRTIEFGLGCKAFIESPIGKRMVNDDEAERLDLMEEAVRLDPDRAGELSRFRDIRFRVAVLDKWQQQIATYIKQGEDAEKEFHEGEAVGVDAPAVEP